MTGHRGHSDVQLFRIRVLELRNPPSCTFEWPLLSAGLPRPG